MPNLTHFRDILKAFIKTHEIRTERNFNDKHVPLRPNTIALRAFNDGTRQDLVRLTLNDFGSYFDKVKAGKYYEYTPFYDKIAKDYPELFPSHIKIPISIKTNREQIVDAINDEIEATSSFARQNPVYANVLEKLEWGIKGKFYYRLMLKNERDIEFNLSDNIPVRISWSASNENLLEGTLVLFDALNETIVLELNRNLSEYEKGHTCRILPGTVDLLLALQNRISLIDESHSYSNQFINGKLEFKTLRGFSLNFAGDLDTSQSSAVEQALSNNLTFIWGPPGTGKTHTLARLIRELLFEGERILVASISNVATDQIAAKVLNELDFNQANKTSILESGKLLRYGYPVLDQVKLESRLFPQKLELNKLIQDLNDLRQQIEKAISTDKKAEFATRCNRIQKEIKEITKKFISNAQCVFTTSTQCQIEAAFLETEWDTLIVDEASMVSITHLIALAMHAKKRIVVAGDFKQLGPITLAQSKYAKRWLNEDSFSPLHISPENPEPTDLKMLTTQRRMHTSISNAISEIFYRGRLQSSLDFFDEDRKSLMPLPNSPMVWYKCFGEAEQKGATRINKVNAIKAIEIAHVLLSQIKSLSIGIITPYRGQVSEIKKQLGEWKGSIKVEKSKIKIGTVHAFQGDESDVIIFDTVDTRELAVGKLFHGQAGDRLVNVAISRAKDKIIFLGDLNLFIDGNGSNNTGRFAKLLQDYIIQRSTTHFDELAETAEISHYRNFLEDCSRSIEKYRRTSVEHKNTAAENYEIGEAHLEAKEYSEAIAHFSLAIEQDENHADAYCRRGDVFGYLDDYKNQIYDFTKALEFYPEDEWLLFDLSMAKNIINDYKGAIQTIDKLLVMNPLDVSALSTRAMYKANDGDYKGALADHLACINAEPHDPDHYYDESRTHWKFGNYQEALKALAVTLKLDDEHFEATELLETIQAELRK